MSDLTARISALPLAKRKLLEKALASRPSTIDPTPAVIGESAAAAEPRRGPASFAQERMWFLSQLNPQSPVYNIPASVRVRGPIEADLVDCVMTEIVRRHESLRTTFEMEGDRLVQVVHRPLQIYGQRREITSCDPGEREMAVVELAEAEAARPFDLQNGPLFRFSLVKLAASEHVMLISMHHIISDGWSIGTLIHEFARLYEAGGGPSPLAPLPLQYADYAAWQREWVNNSATRPQIDYWRRQLKGLETLIIPSDRPRSPVQSFRGDSVTLEIAPDLGAQLRRFCADNGFTVFMALTAALKILLLRYSGQEDIAIGTPIAGRVRKEFEPLIGLFVNTLVLRTDLSGDPTILEALQRERHVALDAFACQDIPFEHVVHEIDPGRDLSRNPIFQVMLAMQQGPGGALKVNGLEFEPRGVGNSTAKFDLLLAVQEDADQLRGWIDFSVDLFDRATVERMAQHFARILAEFARSPQKRIGRISLLAPHERERILADWNPPFKARRPVACIQHFFESQARQNPDRVAVVFEQGRLSYWDLNARANQLARALRSKGVRQGAVVGVCLARSIDMVAALLAILKAGAAYLPLDPTYPIERLNYMLQDARAALILVDNPALDAAQKNPLFVSLPAMAEASTAESVADLERSASPSDLAYIVYTSGSTGRPKGVMIEHRNAVSFLFGAMDMLSPEEFAGALASTSICFDLSVFEIFAPLASGGTVVLVRNILELADPGKRFEYPITLINTVPSALRELLKVKAIPPTVRVINLAGEPLTAQLADQIYRQANVSRVFDLYGPSETTTYSTGVLRRSGDPATIGRALPNQAVYLLDRHGQPVPPGIIGELFIGGAGVARGYFGRSDSTAERFLPDPFTPHAGGRMYRTGDLARWTVDGRLVFLGRKDHQIKLRGFRIELGEIESAIVSCTAVSDAAVVTRRDSDGDAQILAYVVFKAEHSDEASRLRSALRQQLPEHMVPAALIAVASVPRTPNGKVDRAALPEPEFKNEISQDAPITWVEKQIQDIWESLLGLKGVGLNQSFFEVGGHSLKAVQLASRIHDQFEVELTLAEIFQNPTISALAELLNHKLDVALAALDAPQPI